MNIEKYWFKSFNHLNDWLVNWTTVKITVIVPKMSESVTFNKFSWRDIYFAYPPPHTHTEYFLLELLFWLNEILWVYHISCLSPLAVTPPDREGIYGGHENVSITSPALGCTTDRWPQQLHCKSTTSTEVTFPMGVSQCLRVAGILRQTRSCKL